MSRKVVYKIPKYPAIIPSREQLISEYIDLLMVLARKEDDPHQLARLLNRIESALEAAQSPPEAGGSPGYAAGPADAPTGRLGANQGTIHDNGETT